MNGSAGQSLGSSCRSELPAAPGLERHAKLGLLMQAD
jgi:hypothetical protein